MAFVEWVEEKISGVKDWRKRERGELVDSLVKGDSLIVAELSRLGRSTLDILQIMNVAKEKEINVYRIQSSPH